VNSAEHCGHCIENTKDQEKKKRYVFSLDLNVDSVVDDVTSGGREFHVRDAAAGKAGSPIVRRHVELTKQNRERERDDKCHLRRTCRCQWLCQHYVHGT